MKINKILISSFVFLSTAFLQAQCLTDHLEHQHSESIPGYHEKMEKMEQEVKVFTDNYKENTRRAKYIIPVVFHVIHTGGVENISKAQILDQMRVMNEDCSGSNPDLVNLRTPFKGREANLDIEFRLARIDPDGNCTDGINRVYSYLTNDARDNVKSLPGVQWDYTKYLNIYVVSSIENTSGTNGTILGFAVFPFSTNASRDGIVIRADRVGTIGTAVEGGAGRTMTHEIGHWLGLFHPFQGGCSSTGDRVDDTPPVGQTFSNAQCPFNGNSCSNDSPDEIDMWENFMDYSRGTCQVMFSKGQKVRTDFFLTNSSYTRRLNVSQSNLIATGVVGTGGKPIASFNSDHKVVCVGNPVVFYDGSCKGLVDNREWTFEGADINTSGLESPEVTYSTPGTYKVSLSVSNANGVSDQSIDDYIEVRPQEGTYNQHFIEGFEVDIDDLETMFPIQLSSASGEFRISSSASFTGNQSLFAPISNNTPLGTKFVMETIDLNAKYLRGLPKYLTFQTAYAPDPNQGAEELRVFVSTDCGARWRQIYFRPSTALGSGSETSDFIPSSSNDWRRQFVNLGSALVENDSNFRLRFEVTSDRGNSVYIDNINLSQFISSNPTVDNLDEIKMFPNPTSGILNVQTKTAINQVLVLNSLGKVVYRESLTGALNHQIDLENLANGVYMVRFVSDNNTFAQKLILNR